MQESRGTLFSVLRDTKSSDLPLTVPDAFPSTTGVQSVVERKSMSWHGTTTLVWPGVGTMSLDLVGSERIGFLPIAVGDKPTALSE